MNTAANSDALLSQLIDKIDNMQSSIDKLGKGLSEIKDVTDRLDRRVEAIETAPTPYGRPRHYHGGVGVHSVSGSTPGLARYLK